MLTLMRSACSTCRRRKIKCDGSLPICLNCRKGNRHCERLNKDLRFVLHSANPIQASQESFLEHKKVQTGVALPKDRDQSKEQIEARASVTSNPQGALQNPVIASLFRHYVDFLAPWYDLNDSKNLFGTTVPTRALNNAILFKAIIAFAACHQHRVSGKLAGLGPVYHAACVNDLLAEIHDIHLELLGDYLAATCLLRSYEILNGNTRQQQHLLGAYSFAASGPIDLTTWGIPQAGTWNYLREEITVGLESRRPVRISTGFEFDPRKEMSDDMWANAISYLLTRAINLCFKERGEESLESRVLTWRSLAADVAAWKEHRPATFDPFSTASRFGNIFPSIWLIKPWHVAGEQYFSITKSLLALSEPLQSAPTWGLTNRESIIPCIRDEALRVCGLAYTNDDIAARVNAFGPLAFCGRYLSDKYLRDGLIAMLKEFSIPTGWPVQPIIDDLRTFWAEY